MAGRDESRRSSPRAGPLETDDEVLFPPCLSHPAHFHQMRMSLQLRLCLLMPLESR